MNGDTIPKSNVTKPDSFQQTLVLKQNISKEHQQTVGSNFVAGHVPLQQLVNDHSSLMDTHTDKESVQTSYNECVTVVPNNTDLCLVQINGQSKPVNSENVGHLNRNVQSSFDNLVTAKLQDNFGSYKKELDAKTICKRTTMNRHVVSNNTATFPNGKNKIGNGLEVEKVTQSMGNGMLNDAYLTRGNGKKQMLNGHSMTNQSVETLSPMTKGKWNTSKIQSNHSNKITPHCNGNYHVKGKNRISKEDMIKKKGGRGIRIYNLVVLLLWKFSLSLGISFSKITLSSPHLRN